MQDSQAILSERCFSERYSEIQLVVQRTIRKYFFRYNGLDLFEDLVQESLTGVFEAMRQGRLRDDRKILDFTASVAFYTGCKMVQRQKKSPSQLDETAQISDHGRSPEEVLLAKERDDQLEKAIAEIDSEMDRELLRRCFRGEKIYETQAGLRLTPGQFRNRKSRALKDLAVAIHQIGQPGFRRRHATRATVTS